MLQKVLKRLTLVITVATMALLPFFGVKAQNNSNQELLNFTMVRLAPRDDYATIFWRTNIEAVGTIRYGLTNGFGSSVSDHVYAKNHETHLGGLKPETDYFIQIVAIDANGRTIYSPVYDFETTDEDDAEPPTLSNVRVNFASGNRAQFVWETNEKAYGCVFLGRAIDDLKKARCGQSGKMVHDVVVDKLSRSTHYYYQIAVKDRHNNEQFSVYHEFTTAADEDIDVPDVEVLEITPEVNISAEGNSQALITILTNRPVDGVIRIGEQSKRYSKRIDFSDPRTVRNQILLTNLEFDEDYFYMFEIRDIFGKYIKTPEFRFKTLPSQNIVTPNDTFNPADAAQDYDADGLSNAQEVAYGTNPRKADTDGDGYIDGIEVRHGYNPLGQGRLAGWKESKPTFAYGQPRGALAEETRGAIELKVYLERYFGGPIPVARRFWPTLVNSYVYGHYPVEAIYKSIIHGGKTVHPYIIWEAWRNHTDYKSFINR